MHFPLIEQTILLQPEPVRLYVPDAGVVRKAYEKGEIPFPYWSQVWPASIALAQFILSHPAYIASKDILELGAGLGLPSLVSARFAASVHCTDVAPEAVAVVKASTKLLNLENVCTSVLDWTQLPPDLSCHVLLLSDINYEPAAFACLQNVVKLFLESGTRILLSTPQRLMAKDFIMPLLVYCNHQEEVVVHEGKPVATTVMVLEPTGKVSNQNLF
ncbi:MAG TPA: methyltransferase [Flavisolibacter sp.]|nr:methyltransferase [Flavisolibacter sp.]